MFNSYSDAQLMNDSFVFYTSTNTFKNPAFVHDQVAHKGLIDDADGYGLDHHTLQRKHHHQMVREEQKQEASKDCSQHSIEQEEEKGSTCYGGTKQKLIDFCDNFAFSLKAKAFIMETNFKRRLRGVKRFLNKRLLPLVVKQRQGGGPMAPHDQSARRHASRLNGGGGGGSGNLGDLIRVEREQLYYNQLLSNHHHHQQNHHLPKLSEPISAKALGVQQEHILTRLQRIKRDRSQKLFNMQHASSTTIMESSEQEGDDTDDSMEYSGHCFASHASSQLDLDTTQHGPSTNGGRLHDVPFWLNRSNAHVTSSRGGECVNVEDEKNSRASQQQQQADKTTVYGRSWAAISEGKQQMKRVATYALAQPKKTCIVCYERAPNIVTLPCEHSDICSDCFIEIIYMAVKSSQYPLRCVLCRQKIERIRCSRRLMLSVIKRNRSCNFTRIQSRANRRSKFSTCNLLF